MSEGDKRNLHSQVVPNTTSATNSPETIEPHQKSPNGNSGSAAPHVDTPVKQLPTTDIQRLEMFLGSERRPASYMKR
jgi:hypothetical protein